MMGAWVRNFVDDLWRDLRALDTELVLFAVIVVASIIVLDSVSIFLQRRRRELGLDGTKRFAAVDGSERLPARSYVSHSQGLAGKPDALIIEAGFVIPVEHKPLARKIRDRHVAQLLVYMRLIEEFEGKRPPYGYLILGPKARRVRIENTADRQRWLQRLIDEMRGILAGAAAVPTPHPKKCPKCEVRAACTYRVGTD